MTIFEIEVGSKWTSETINGIKFITTVESLGVRDTEVRLSGGTENDYETRTIPTHLIAKFVDAGVWQPLRDGQPCHHPGCLQHVTHPCEYCGRIAGRVTSTKNSEQNGEL